MTEDQSESRYERVAICMAEGMTREEAERIADLNPAENGLREKEQHQEQLFS
jgi:hypothetical protein